MTTLKIKNIAGNSFESEISKINIKKEIIDNDTLLPNENFKYNIHKVIKTDFHTIESTSTTNVYVCCFKILESVPGKAFSHPFLQYLLYKYPKSNTNASNLCVFPFSQKKNNKIKDVGKRLVKEIFNETYNCLGYIQNKNGVFLFYNIDEGISKIKRWNSNNDLWWCLIDEICNHKKLIYFPIHNLVSELFYQNRKLIYLKNKDNKVIESPTVAYYGCSHELLSYIAALGMKSSAMREYGPYYYFTNYLKAIRFGGWTTSLQKSKMFGKEVSSENGKFIQGGIIRFALFLKKSRVILYQNLPNSKNEQILLDDIKSNDKPGFQDEKKLGKTKGKWTKKYDSLVISNIKFKNMSGYFNYHIKYVVKEPLQFTSLSTHLIDNDTLSATWDPYKTNYLIK